MATPSDARNLHVPNCVIPYRCLDDVWEMASDTFGLIFPSSNGDLDPNWEGSFSHRQRRPATLSATISCMRLHIGNFASADQANCWCSTMLKTPLIRARQRHWEKRATGLLLILDAQLSALNGQSASGSTILAILKPFTPDTQGVLSALSNFPLLVTGGKGEVAGHHQLLYVGDHPEIGNMAPLPEQTAYLLIKTMVTTSLRSSPWEA